MADDSEDTESAAEEPTGDDEARDDEGKETSFRERVEEIRQKRAEQEIGRASGRERVLRLV